MGIKLYATIAAALALIGGGWYVRGVFAERVELKIQVKALAQDLNAVTNDRDQKATELKSYAQQLAIQNEMVSNLAQELSKRRAAVDDAQKKIAELEGKYGALQANLGKPLPPGCEDAVRETARRLGSMP